MSPRTIKEARTVEWRATIGPIRCRCGHNHYGRIPVVRNTGRVAMGNYPWAPQWGFCEDDGCDCTALRRLPDPIGVAQ